MNSLLFFYFNCILKDTERKVIFMEENEEIVLTEEMEKELSNGKEEGEE
jgi:hypothetical protein